MDSSRISTDAPLKENDLNDELKCERILSFIEVSEDEDEERQNIVADEDFVENIISDENGDMDVPTEIKENSSEIEKRKAILKNATQNSKNVSENGLDQKQYQPQNQWHILIHNEIIDQSSSHYDHIQQISIADPAISSQYGEKQENQEENQNQRSLEQMENKTNERQICLNADNIADGCASNTKSLEKTLAASNQDFVDNQEDIQKTIFEETNNNDHQLIMPQIDSQSNHVDGDHEDEEKIEEETDETRKNQESTRISQIQKQEVVYKKSASIRIARYLEHVDGDEMSEQQLTIEETSNQEEISRPCSNSLYFNISRERKTSCDSSFNQQKQLLQDGEIDDCIGENNMEVSCNQQKEKSGDGAKEIIDSGNIKYSEQNQKDQEINILAENGKPNGGGEYFEEEQEETRQEQVEKKEITVNGKLQSGTKIAKIPRQDKVNMYLRGTKGVSLELGALKKTNSLEFKYEARQFGDKKQQKLQPVKQDVLSPKKHLKQPQQQQLSQNLLQPSQYLKSSHLSSKISANKAASPLQHSQFHPQPHQQNASQQTIAVRRGADLRKFITFLKLQLVRRIIRTYEKLNVLRRFSSVPEGFFRQFGDKASWHELVSQQSSIQQKVGLAEEDEKNISKLVLYQDNKLVIALKILVIIASMIQCIEIPLRFAFVPQNTQFDIHELHPIYTIAPSIIFFIDMYVNFNLAYFSKGKLIQNRKEIITNYFFGAYWFDLLSVILQVVLSKSLPSLMVRIYVLNKEVERILASFQIQEKFYYAYRVIRLVLELLLSSHLLACLFIITAQFSLNNNWIIASSFQHLSQEEIYLNSLYYIIVTMTTIGYGDIHPYSNPEKIFFCVVGFITSGLFAYNISTISSIVNDSIRKKLETKQQILSVSEYMTERNISRSIQNQILQQLYYNKSMEKRSPEAVTECIKVFHFFLITQLFLFHFGLLSAIKHISDDLKGSLFNEYFGKILQENIYLKRKFSKQFLNSLIPKFKEEVFPPGSMIFQEGNVDERLVYVRKGLITLFLSFSDPTPIVQDCKEGKWFGLEELFTGQERNCSGKILEFTSIVYITRSDFLESLSSFPRDKEVFNMIKDKILYSNLRIGVSCSVCKSIFHQIHLCPFIHFVKKKEYIIQKYNYSLSSKREAYPERRNVKYNARSTNEQVRYQLKNFRMTLLLFAEGVNLFQHQLTLDEEATLILNRQADLLCQESPLVFQRNKQGNKLSKIEEKTVESYNASMFQSRDSSNTNKHNNINFPSNVLSLKPTQSKPEYHVSPSEQVSPKIACDTPLFFNLSPETSKKNNNFSLITSEKQEENISEHSSEDRQNGLDEKGYPESFRKTKLQLEQEFNDRQIGKAQGETISVELSSDESERNAERETKMKPKQQHDKQYQINVIQLNKLANGSKVKYEKKNTFVLNPETLNSVIRILPSTLETDQEFFQKYDGFKWENDKIVVLPSENQLSQTSFITDPIPPSGVQDLTPNQISYLQGHNNNITHNFSSYNSRSQTPSHQYQDAHTKLPSQLSQLQYFKHNSIQVFPEIGASDDNHNPNNYLEQQQQQMILQKILNEVELIKHQQDLFRQESTKRVSTFEKRIGYALQKTFTLSAQKYADSSPENPPKHESLQRNNEENHKTDEPRDNLRNPNNNGQNSESEARKFGSGAEDVSFGKVVSEKATPRTGYFVTEHNVGGKNFSEGVGHAGVVESIEMRMVGEENRQHRSLRKIESNHNEFRSTKNISNDQKQTSSRKLALNDVSQSVKKPSEGTLSRQDSKRFKQLHRLSLHNSQQLQNDKQYNHLFLQNQQQCPRLPLLQAAGTHCKLSMIWDEALSGIDEADENQGFGGGLSRLQHFQSNQAGVQTQQQHSPSYLAKFKMKERAEFIFFAAFERQNNWKAYFPIYNLSYITQRLIREQRQRMKFGVSQPQNRVEESALQVIKKPKGKSKYLGLSQLVQDNRERTISANNSRLTQIDEVETILRRRSSMAYNNLIFQSFKTSTQQQGQM